MAVSTPRYRLRRELQLAAASLIALAAGGSSSGWAQNLAIPPSAAAGASGSAAAAGAAASASAATQSQVFFQQTQMLRMAVGAPQLTHADFTVGFHDAPALATLLRADAAEAVAKAYLADASPGRSAFRASVARALSITPEAAGKLGEMASQVIADAKQEFGAALEQKQRDARTMLEVRRGIHIAAEGPRRIAEELDPALVDGPQAAAALEHFFTGNAASGDVDGPAVQPAAKTIRPSGLIASKGNTGPSSSAAPVESRAAVSHAEDVHPNSGRTSALLVIGSVLGAAAVLAASALSGAGSEVAAMVANASPAVKAAAALAVGAGAARVLLGTGLWGDSAEGVKRSASVLGLLIATLLSAAGLYGLAALMVSATLFGYMAAGGLRNAVSEKPPYNAAMYVFSMLGGMISAIFLAASISEAAPIAAIASVTAIFYCFAIAASLGGEGRI